MFQECYFAEEDKSYDEKKPPSKKPKYVTESTAEIHAIKDDEEEKKEEKKKESPEKEEEKEEKDKKEEEREKKDEEEKDKRKQQRDKKEKKRSESKAKKEKKEKKDKKDKESKHMVLTRLKRTEKSLVDIKSQIMQITLARSLLDGSWSPSGRRNAPRGLHLAESVVHLMQEDAVRVSQKLQPAKPMAKPTSGCDPEKCIAPATLTGYVVKAVDVQRPFFTADAVCDNENGRLAAKHGYYGTATAEVVTSLVAIPALVAVHNHNYDDYFNDDNDNDYDHNHQHNNNYNFHDHQYDHFHHYDHDDDKHDHHNNDIHNHNDDHHIYNDNHNDHLHNHDHHNNYHLHHDHYNHNDYHHDHININNNHDHHKHNNYNNNHKHDNYHNQYYDNNHHDIHLDNHYNNQHNDDNYFDHNHHDDFNNNYDHDHSRYMFVEVCTDKEKPYLIHGCALSSEAKYINCKTPATTRGYVITETGTDTELELGELHNWDVKAQCAALYHGAAKVTECDDNGLPYGSLSKDGISGCEPDTCIDPTETAGYDLTVQELELWKQLNCK
ncbi:hypothetical protein AK812_SmicGene41007 [Symbiodinium microadriaticum]|uniref:Uncharacterized protein n=1 Tax=Symbiodinium microadriaticum TaxID=2951 RepID=A0A1Q9C772_SYMMI|nr:hypothetical protein AK812_SmicGene41007 [Symbiodinium microadriaticum]